MIFHMFSFNPLYHTKTGDTMEKIIHKGVEGVFYPKDEYKLLRETVIAQNELIEQLKKGVGVNG